MLFCFITRQGQMDATLIKSYTYQLFQVIQCLIPNFNFSYQIVHQERNNICLQQIC